jgi:AcrR family transcriptional regulator
MSTMSAKPADPSIRDSLVETAAHIIATEGLGKLTLRRLAADVGTSTMAIYTHFGGVQELRRAVRQEGFARLGADLNAVDHTDDPVADYLVLGWAYYRNATQNPDLYRAMFLDGPIDEADQGTGLETFAICVEAAERCTEAGRFSPGDAGTRALVLWSILHGLASLQLANLLDGTEALRALADAGADLFTAWGDDRRATDRSLSTAIDRMGTTG